MLLAPVGTALVILFALVDFSEQRIRQVCLRIPSILSRRRTLSSVEERHVRAVIAETRRTWTSPLRFSRPRFTFVRHGSIKVCRIQKRELTAPKNDGKVVAREKRSTCPCRKDYRQMTKKEMKIFHRALKRLKASGVYDNLVDFHHPSLSPAAHFGAAFLPWHREYLYQLEQAMRALGNKFKQVTVPFWDSCMDEKLPDPRDCVVWTNQFWGRSNGEVNNGKLARNWDATAACHSIGTKLTRSTSGNPGLLLTREKISNDMLPSATFTELALFSPLEGYHGDNHLYVGGHLGNIQCSPNDPIFFLLHAMFDCIWEEWSKLPAKINTYPVPGVHGATLANIGGSIHLGNAPMNPFPLNNIHGLTWNGYTCCAQRPSKIQCANDADCNSSQGLLFCHQCLCHCKIKSGGDCSGFPNNACYSGTCILNTCI